MNAKNATVTKRARKTLTLLGKHFDQGPRGADSVTIKPARVSGPYHDANVNSYRLVVFDGEKRKSVRAGTLEEALALKTELERSLDRSDRTIGNALEEFIADQRKRGLKDCSIETVEYKLRHFLPVDQLLLELTPEQAQAVYTADTERQTRFGAVMRAQTHQKTLRMARRFFRWAVERNYARINPFEKVRTVGKARAGKEQLRLDEARLVTELVVCDAHQGIQGAIALYAQVLLGLRSGEVLARKVRDLDDEGRILWIPSGKTENARRRLEVPEALRPFLLTLAEGKPPERLLFERKNRAPYYNMWLWKNLKRYCALAGVPRVCPHSLRGLHSSLAVAAGCTSTAVASALGHGSFAITAKHYVNADTLANSKAKRVADALAGATQGQTDEATELLERLRALPPEARNALLRALEVAKPAS